MPRWATVVALVAAGAMTISWTNVPMTSSDGTIRLSGKEAEGYELWHHRDQGWSAWQEHRWWGFDEGDHIVQASFWYFTSDAGYWSDEEVRKDGFLDDFGALDGARDRRLTDGSTVASALGDIETLMFDVEEWTYDSPTRECVGFRHWWDRNLSGYRKILDFYACGKGGVLMPQRLFINILQGLSIKGEFDTLVED